MAYIIQRLRAFVWNHVSGLTKTSVNRMFLLQTWGHDFNSHIRYGNLVLIFKQCLYYFFENFIQCILTYLCPTPTPYHCFPHNVDIFPFYLFFYSPSSPVHIIQLVMGVWPDLDCGQFTRFYITQENWILVSQ